jgi:hypothetical protein
MTIELFYMTSQLQQWLNARIARHLAEQAERLGPAVGAEPGVSGRVAFRRLGGDGAAVSSAEVGRMGLSGCYGGADEVAGADDTEADLRCPAAQVTMADRERHTVSA